MPNDLMLFIVIGFAAQVVDGAIGMAYGITATTILMSSGVTPATASAPVHAAEVFTTAAFGAAHWRMGNVDRKLVARLAVPGMVGGALDAYVLATVSGERIRPFGVLAGDGVGDPVARHLEEGADQSQDRDAIWSPRPVGRVP